MILMGGVSMLLFVGMPYIMDNSTKHHTLPILTTQRANLPSPPPVDPEMKAEFEARQKAGPMGMMAGGAQQESPLGNFDMAGFLAGSQKKDSGNGGGGAKNQGIRR
jgi:ER membrane protein complex subunit 7